MMRLRRILRDYSEAGAVNALIALWGFVDDDTFLTKAGHVGVVYQPARARRRGPDARPARVARPPVRGGATPAGRALPRLPVRGEADSRSIRCAAPCRRRSRTRRSQRRADYLNERRDGLFRVDHFLVLLYEPPTAVRTRSTSEAALWRSPRAGIPRTGCRTNRTCALLEGELDRAVSTLHHKARASRCNSPSVGLRRLRQGRGLHVLPAPGELRPGALSPRRRWHTTRTSTTSSRTPPIECHRDQLIVGRQTVKVLSMKEPPAQTFAHMLGGPGGRCRGSSSPAWNGSDCPSDRVRRDIQSRRRHFFNKRVSLINYVSSETRPEEMLVDDSAGATVRQLGDALTETGSERPLLRAGCSLTLVLYGSRSARSQRTAAEAMKVLAAHDGSAFEETYNLLNAWLSIVPGNGAYNLRRLALLETNLADLSFLFTHDPGEPVSAHLGRASAGGVRDAVADALLLQPARRRRGAHAGARRDGQRQELSPELPGHAPAAVRPAHRRPRPGAQLPEAGHPARRQLPGARTRASRASRSIRSICRTPTPEQLHFLHAFTRVLLEGEDGYRLSDLEDRETYEAVENLFVLDQRQRRLFTLANLLPRALGARLHKWVEGGRYAAMFDNAARHADDGSPAGVRLRVDARVPVAARAVAVLRASPRERACPRSGRGGDAEGVRHGRGVAADPAPDASCVRAGGAEDLAQARMPRCCWRRRASTTSRRSICSAPWSRAARRDCCCRTRRWTAGSMRELFQMNEMELDLLAAPAPRQQVLLKRPDLAKVLTLRVDPKSYWIYTNTPIDNERVAAVLREHGFAAGIDRLAASA